MRVIGQIGLEVGKDVSELGQHEEVDDDQRDAHGDNHHDGVAQRGLDAGPVSSSNSMCRARRLSTSGQLAGQPRPRIMAR